MEKNIKYSIYIGLLQKDMKTELNTDKTIKLISIKFKKIGIIGFNCDKIKGYWNRKPEPALKISFINNFGVKTKDILKVLEKLKTHLKQESILIEQEQVLYNFI